MLYSARATIDPPQAVSDDGTFINGIRHSWIAVRNNTDVTILDTLGLEKTGETNEWPESDWRSARLGDWMLVWCNHNKPKWSHEAASKFAGDVIVCDVEEHVMFVSVAAFKDGAQSWRVVHDSQEARDHLAVEGKPPESFARIRAEESARVDEDPEVDFIFEIPVRMAHEIVGFRHDQGPDLQFDVLRAIPGTKPKWKFW